MEQYFRSVSLVNSARSSYQKPCCPYKDQPVKPQSRQLEHDALEKRGSCGIT
jgi:hypothetical protein